MFCHSVKITEDRNTDPPSRKKETHKSNPKPGKHNTNSSFLAAMCRNIPVHWQIRGVILIGTSIVLLSFLSQQGTGSTGSFSLFTWHPTLMILAFSGLMSEGAIHYRLSTNTLKQARLSHGAIFALVTVMAFASLIVILTNKVKIKHEITPHTAHAILGTITLVLLAYQATSGVSKLRWLWKTANKIHPTHGKLGIYVVYTLGFATMILGLSQTETGQSFWLAACALFVVYAVVLYTFVKRKRTVVDTTYDHIETDELDALDDIGDSMDFS